MDDYLFTLAFDVRDYELDAAGMVNNAAYLHYLEHTRHEFLKRHGIDFATLAESGTFLVVTRIEVDYLLPLRSGDRFVVGLNANRISRLRFGFTQDIYRLPDEKPVLKAVVVGTVLNERGRPTHLGPLEALFQGLQPPEQP